MESSRLVREERERETVRMMEVRGKKRERKGRGKKGVEGLKTGRVQD